MAATKVDMQVLSVSPQTFLYAQPPALAAAFARIQNEQMAKQVQARPDRFHAIATLPMQAPKLAADELDHAMRVLGLAGAQIGSNIAGRNLDDPELEPVWEVAAKLGAFILIHPINVAGIDRLSSYYLNNLVGNPLDTTIAAACLVFGGVLERYPSLKICLAHGGGFVPYQAGRFVHGWHVRTEPKRKLAKPPTASLNRFCFDTIVHSKEALAFLVGSAGADRVLLGSDYPFDMGMPDGVLQVRALAIPEADQAAILGGRAQALLGAAAPKFAPRSHLKVGETQEEEQPWLEAARTPGATRAGDGQYLFDLAKVNHILGGPDYSTANGACVEGDRMIVGLMRMPAGTGAEAHSHPNEQWIYILEGTFRAKVGDKEIEARPGSVVYIPSNVIHSGTATAEADVVFFTVKDASTACMESGRRNAARPRIALRSMRATIAGIPMARRTQ